MRRFDLVCNECRHHYQVECDTAWVDKEKYCPKCGADTVHQTLKSYLRNGSLLTEDSLRNLQCRSSCCCVYRSDESDDK